MCHIHNMDNLHKVEVFVKKNDFTMWMQHIRTIYFTNIVDLIWDLDIFSSLAYTWIYKYFNLLKAFVDLNIINNVCCYEKKILKKIFYVSICYIY